jgi:endonuclease III
MASLICVAHKQLSAEDKIRRLITFFTHYGDQLGLTLIEQLTQRFGPSPYVVLVGCLLSLRSRDSVTIHAATALLSEASTPQEMMDMSLGRIEQLITSVGFYANKARVIKGVSEYLVAHYGGVVPHAYEQLIALKGVGPKTANLVLSAGFNIPALCVDTHVHRLSNAWGLVHTRTPEKTEKVLRVIVPFAYWTRWNRWLVLWGQKVYGSHQRRCPWCALDAYEKKVTA